MSIFILSCFAVTTAALIFTAVYTWKLWKVVEQIRGRQ